MRTAFVWRRWITGATLALASLTLAQLARSAPDASAPEPAAPAPDPSAPSSKPATQSLESLRAEHDALKDALFRSRARRQAVENAMLATKLGTVLTWDGGRRYVLASAELRLDGVRIWESRETILSGQPVTLAHRGTPAGIHVLGVRVEVRARDNPRLGYVSEQSFSFSLPEGKKTTVEITVDEDGSLPSYNPDIEVDIDVD